MTEKQPCDVCGELHDDNEEIVWIKYWTCQKHKNIPSAIRRKKNNS